MRFLTSSACLLVCIASPASAGFSAGSNFGSAPAPRSPILVDRPSEPSIPRPGLLDSPSPPSIGRDLSETKRAIRTARKAGLISRSQARQLRREANVLRRHVSLYGRDGFSDSERDELETRSLYLMDAVYTSSSSAGAAK